MADELRLVLLGGYSSGKSNVAHSFLNVKCESDQITTQCVKMEGNIHGRKIILVETPGWWKCVQLCDTPERLKAELVKSTNICPPGPHVFLLVIEVECAFSEKHRKEAESHMQFIGDDIWNQTIIVFTKLKHLGDKTIQQYVESEGENLNKLTQKCGNRYVGFDTDLDTDGSQAKELFRQIEKLVAENNGVFFQVDARRLMDLEITMKNVEEKAAAREHQVLEKRRKLKEIKSAVSGEEINTELFINKHQLKDALEREWNRREAADSSRTQFKQKCLDNNDMSSCVDDKDIQMSLAKVHEWYQRHHLSDYGSVSSNEEHEKTQQD